MTTDSNGGRPPVGRGFDGGDHRRAEPRLHVPAVIEPDENLVELAQDGARRLVVQRGRPDRMPRRVRSARRFDALAPHVTDGDGPPAAGADREGVVEVTS